MHFHTISSCQNCGFIELYNTPIPDVLCAGDLCRSCGAPDMIGIDLLTRQRCPDCGKAYVERLMNRWINDPGPAGWP